VDRDRRPGGRSVTAAARRPVGDTGEVAALARGDVAPVRRRRHAVGMNWLVWSIVASVLLTIVANVVIRLWPGADRSARRLEDWVAGDAAGDAPRPGGFRVIVPLTAMVVISVVLTVVINLVLWLG
jgi:hypothetical protein